MQAGALRRWTSEGGTPRRTPLHPSREGSAPAVSPEVRCACQFFQSDSILPDRVLRPAVSRNTSSVRPRSDHEYEPIGKPVTEREVNELEPVAPEIEDTEMSPPAPPATPPPATQPPPSVFVSEPELAFKADDASSTTSHERQMLRPSTEDAMDYEGGEDTEPPSSSIALQKEIEDRYFNTPTTTESRTDCEISTSQVDSSALENLPLKRENRKRSAVGEEAAKLQQKIKNQTGKLRTKLKTIKKPQFTMPNKPKFNLPERPKFNLPERPKFNFPERPKFERPKFNLPERPKFNLPERPKFNLPDRPKFNLPERPKFNLPDRPKINLPDRPKFKMPEKPKFLEKAKFNLPDRPKFSMPDKSKFKIPERAKLTFSSFRNKENVRKEKSEQATDSTSGSKKRMIDFDFRTYPRLAKFKKDKKGGKTSKGERPGTPPPGFATVPRVTKDRQAVMSTSHWEDMSSNMSSEEPRHYGLPKDYPNDKDSEFESKLAQVDKDYNQMQEEYEREKMHIAKVKLENAELWNAMEKSSAQRLEHRGSLPHYLPDNDEFDNMVENGDDESSAASTGHHRRGVLEEIDNDEFFLRQKGISQDNIEVGKYLSNEIRDAFRPPVNTLNQLDGMASGEQVDEPFDDNVDQTDIQEDIDQIQDIDHDDGYYTFPPVRPSRSRKQKALESKIQQEEQLESESSVIEIPNIPAPPIFQEAPVRREEELPRKSLFSNGFKESEMLQNLNEYENEVDQTRDMPTVPKRRKKLPKQLSYSESGSLFNEPYEEDKWKPKNQDDMMEDEIIVHRMEFVMPNVESELPEESPVPPRRVRSRSRGSRATSACDDDRTSRGAESLTLDSHTHLPTADIEWSLDDIPDDSGYAIVDKAITQKKVEPPPRPPAPVRRNRSCKSLSADRQFFTVPRALKESTPPKRPNRNYSTLGPSRPPRKKSTTSLTDLKTIPSSIDTTQYVEIDDELDLHKDLQSGDVINKMKDRPLPPPPRPPRGPKRRKDDDKKDDNDLHFVTDGEINVDLDATDDIEERIFRILPSREDFEEKLPIDDYDQDEIIEIEVSTQTDPLPDDFDYTIGMDEPFIDNERIIIPSQIPFEDDVDLEENSIDVEILTKGLQRFRESSRPSSRAERSRTPADRPKTPIERPKTPLGRSSPTAILVERRVSSPTRIGERNVMLTEASLTVMPIDDPDSYETESKSFDSQIQQPPLLEEVIIPSVIEEIITPQHVVLPQTTRSKIDEIAMPQHVVPPQITTFKLEEVVTPQEVAPQQTTSFKLEDVVIPQQVATPQTTSSKLEEERSIAPISIPQVTESKTVVPLQSEQVEERQIVSQLPVQLVIPETADVEVVRTQRLQVTDLEVERLSVAELQASKILVSEIEGLSLQVSDVNTKSGNLVVRGLELGPGILDEILQRFAQLTPPSAPTPPSTQTTGTQKSDITQETQTDPIPEPEPQPEISTVRMVSEAPPPPPSPPTQQDLEMHDDSINGEVPERPPLPQMPPSMYPMAYYPECSMRPSTFYRLRSPTERPPQDSEGDPPLPSSRRRKHKREVVSSSDEEYRPTPRRAPTRSAEPSVVELSTQLFRACQTSIGRTARYLLTYITSQFGNGENKKDMQMALVIVLVMIAGLILLGVGEGRTVHHHHWDFFNPPSDDK